MRKSTKGKGMQKRIKGGLGTIGKKERKVEAFRKSAFGEWRQMWDRVLIKRRKGYHLEKENMQGGSKKGRQRKRETC
jgi:hypothetical protein